MIASAKQETKLGQLSNQSWHIIRGQANVVFLHNR